MRLDSSSRTSKREKEQERHGCFSESVTQCPVLPAVLGGDPGIPASRDCLGGDRAHHRYPVVRDADRARDSGKQDLPRVGTSKTSRGTRQDSVAWSLLLSRVALDGGQLAAVTVFCSYTTRTRAPSHHSLTAC